MIINIFNYQSIEIRNRLETGKKLLSIFFFINYRSIEIRYRIETGTNRLKLEMDYQSVMVKFQTVFTLKLLMSSVQTPPLRHGVGWHSLTSVSHRSPVKPGRHWHRYLLT